MAPEYCKTAGKICDPTNCPREFCSWRDSEWALKRLGELTYSGDTTWITELMTKKSENQKKKRNI